MRRFELVLLFAAVFAVAWPAVFGVRSRRGIVAGGLIAALIAQLQIEGFSVADNSALRACRWFGGGRHPVHRSTTHVG